MWAWDGAEETLSTHRHYSTLCPKDAVRAFYLYFKWGGGKAVFAQF